MPKGEIILQKDGTAMYKMDNVMMVVRGWKGNNKGQSRLEDSFDRSHSPPRADDVTICTTFHSQVQNRPSLY
jgi:hypothetical protein